VIVLIVIVIVLETAGDLYNLIIYKHPHLIVRSVGDDFYFVKNPYISNGERLLNLSQYNVFSLFNGKNSIVDVATLLNLQFSQVLKFYKLIKSQSFVNDQDKFPVPKWNYSENTGLNLWIHVTNNCNLSCPYCYIHSIHSNNVFPVQNYNQLGNKILQTVINRKLKTVKIRLSGGEPLLFFNTWKSFVKSLFEKFEKINCKLHVSVLTNLTILNDDIISFAKQYNIGFGVSVDGYEGYHDKTRKFISGEGSFEIVSKNLLVLTNNRINVSVSTVVSDYNMEGLPELTKHLIKLNLPFRYSIVHAVDINRNKLSEILHQCYNLFEDAIVSYNYKFKEKFKLCDLKTSEIYFQTCAFGRFGGAIYCDGGIHSCHVNFEVEEKLGNIFNDEDLISIFEKKRHINDVQSEECLRCDFRYICTSGCPVYRESGKDLSCDIYKEFIPRHFELIGKEKLLQIKKNGIVHP